MTTLATTFVDTLPCTEDEYNDIYNALARRNDNKVAGMMDDAELLIGLAQYIQDRLNDPSQRNCHRS